MSAQCHCEVGRSPSEAIQQSGAVSAPQYGVTMSLVETTIEQHVSTITLHRPDKGNALSPELMRDLIAACKAVAVDDAVRIVVLRSSGKHFCAGADLAWMKSSLGADAEANRADAALISDTMQALYGLPQPVIALVHGAAIGGGVGVVATADIVIAEDSAQFGLAEIRLGLIPSVIAPYVVNKIGETQSRRYFISGERIGACRAAELGLVHEVVPDGSLDAKLAELLDTMRAGGPLAMRAAKQMVRELSPGPDAATVTNTIDAIAAIRVTPEAQEGMQAFFEKRNAAWMRDVQ